MQVNRIELYEFLIFFYFFYETNIIIVKFVLISLIQIGTIQLDTN